MAQITNRLSFYGIPTKIKVDTNTGQAEVVLDGGIFGDTKVAEVGANNNWKVTNLSELTKKFNNKRTNDTIANNSIPQRDLTEDEVNKIFLKQTDPASQGVRQYNNERASILNNNDSYSGDTDVQEKIESLQKQWIKNKIPATVDPITGDKISNDGKGTIIANPEKTPSPVIIGDDLSGAPDAPVLPAPGNVPPPEGELSATRGTSLGGKQVPPSTLRYPTGKAPTGFPFDFIQITSYEYVPAGLDYINTPDKIGESVGSRYGNTTAITTVSLPMQPNLSESHSVGWGGDSLDPIKAILANASMGAIGNITDIEEIQREAGKALGDIEALGRDPASISFIAAYFAGQAVGANISGRTTGQVINPNMELLFSGPSLRTFNFQFRLTPRDEPEAIEIRNIIKSFKANMAVRRSTSNLFLMAPNIFKLKYISGDGSTATEQHPFLNKFKPCAMTAFNVNYTPDGSYMTFENKSLTSYDISMSFSELEPIYQDDYTNNYNSNDMGF